jgi:hypothetical protein
MELTAERKSLQRARRGHSLAQAKSVKRDPVILVPVGLVLPSRFLKESHHADFWKHP